MDPSLSATGPSIHPFPPTGPSDPSIPSSLSSTPSPSHSHSQFQTGGPLIEPHQDLDTFLGSFWTRQMEVVEREERDGKNASLPLARIKKVMKSNGEVKMISAEGGISGYGWELMRSPNHVLQGLRKYDPFTFFHSRVKYGEKSRADARLAVFISELTCRAWLIAESHKRRTLQKSDVAAAIAFSDMFDFLIDIVPREGEGEEGGGGEEEGEVGGVTLQFVNEVGGGSGRGRGDGECE